MSCARHLCSHFGLVFVYTPHLVSGSDTAIKGFEAEHCVHQNVDAAELPLIWNSTTTTAALAGRRIQLVFHLRDTTVYAIGAE